MEITNWIDWVSNEEQKKNDIFQGVNEEELEKINKNFQIEEQRIEKQKYMEREVQRTNKIKEHMKQFGEVIKLKSQYLGMIFYFYNKSRNTFYAYESCSGELHDVTEREIETLRLYNDIN
jgi:hypothetical protein